MYGRPGQNSPKDMFLNGIHGDKCSDAFWKFANLMGHEINLAEWNGYRGDMGKEGITYAETWKDITVIYHLAPKMGAEGHRRLIGNDVGVIFFFDPAEGLTFNPSQISELGQVPQVFGVVQPVGEKYRLAFFHSVNIKSYGPTIPDSLLTAGEMKDLLLMKMYNGLVMTTYCPPLNRLFFIPRAQTLEAIVAEFPADPKKSRKAKTIKDKAKTSEKKNKFDKDSVQKIDGDELMPVSKGDCWVVDRSSKGKDSSKDGKKVYLGISPTQVSIFEQKSKLVVIRVLFANLVRVQMRGSKAITFETTDENGEKVDILFKALSSSETLKINQQVNSCLSKMFQTMADAANK